MQSNSFNDNTIGSLLLLPEILEIFQKTKIPKSDLSSLRTISSSYYKNFNWIYLERCNKYKYIHLTVEGWGNLRQTRILILHKKEDTLKIISDETLKKLMDCDCGYMFHKISIDVCQLEISELTLQLDPIINSLGPHICELDLGRLPCESQLTKSIEYIEKYIKQFINLKKIHLASNISSISMEDLKLFLTNISSNIQIHLTVFDRQMDEAFLAQLNLFLIIRTNELSRFEHLLEIYKQFIPARIEFDLHIQISTVEKLINLTKICLENHTCIYNLYLQLRLDPGLLITIEDKATIEKCLLKLSGMVNDLTLTQISDVKLDLLRGIPIWPKLTCLHINGYEHRLDILKRSPKLSLLLIGGVNWDLCIFHNHQNTEEENLRECFGYLKKIQRIDIYGLGEKAENIKAKLREIVPPDTELLWFFP